MPKIVLIDTDCGVDDALALIFAFRSPELSVKAITTVAGNVGVRKCTLNVRRILTLLQLRDAPLIAQGASKPLRRPLFPAPEVHGADGFGNVGGRFNVGKVPVSASAPDLLLQMCQQYGRRLTIIALGPLTNLAIARKKNPSLFNRVGRIISMGGAFRVPGNTGPVAEFNYFVDPEAAHLILTSGLPVTVIPLDVTEQIAVMRSELEYRARRRANRIARSILQFTRFYMRYHQRTEGFNGGYLHDPMAVAAAIDPSLFQRKRLRVDIETTGRLTRGMTVSDMRRPPRQGRASIDVVFKIDRDRFLKLFHDRLWT